MARKSHRYIEAIFASMAIAVGVGIADIAYSQPVILDFSKYGRTENTTCPSSPGGVCGAVAAINSFTYLQNKNPLTYGNSLVPNLNPDGTAPMDALTFADYYYGFAAEEFGALDGYMESKMWWIENHTPQRTSYSSMYVGSSYNDGNVSTDFLRNELLDGEDIEFFACAFCDDEDNVVAHALTLYGIDTENMKLYFQDPNDPSTPVEKPYTIDGGVLSFTGIFGFEDLDFSVYAAFSESVIPEPTTWAMMIVGFGVIGFRLRRRNLCLQAAQT